MQHVPILNVTINAAADIPRHRFVGFDGKQTTAGQSVYGVTLSDARKGYDTAIQAMGIACVEAAEALPVGTWVASDANGCAVVCAANDSGKVGVVTRSVEVLGNNALILLK